jgi:multidrug efflux system outer membrane protein
MKRLFLAPIAGLLGLAGCMVGPKYERPAALPQQPVPASFSQPAPGEPGWKAATPAADLPRGQWWELFKDPELDRLEALAAAQSQPLAAAAARLEQARAVVQAARSGLFPQVSANPGYTRLRTSGNAPENGQPAGAAYTYGVWVLPADATWEADLWGRVRHGHQAAQARFHAATDDVESARLALQAEVASDYFTLRSLDAERALLAGTVNTYQRSLDLTRNRRLGGIVSDLDVSQAETQLRTVTAQLPALDLQRATLLHALATLCGTAATGFEVHPTGLGTNETALPLRASTLPVALPSELLERRPDIAAAERRMAGANADIGVARAAFYPQLVFNARGGFESVNASTVVDWPSRLWAVGPTLHVPIFTGGRLRAQLAATRGAYAEVVAGYRQTVLTAFQEVEDQLAAQRLLADQLAEQSAALAAARHTLEIANNRYQAGLVTYLEVAIAQSAALTDERIVVQLQGQRFVASVGLIKALGGGWTDQRADATAPKGLESSSRE